MRGEDGTKLHIMRKNLLVLAKDSGQEAESKDDCRLHGEGLVLLSTPLTKVVDYLCLLCYGLMPYIC